MLSKDHANYTRIALVEQGTICFGILIIAKPRTKQVM
jgi:hypothetical protein